MVLGFSKLKKKKATAKRRSSTTDSIDVVAVKDDSTTTTELTEMSESFNSPSSMKNTNLKKQSRTGTSLFKKNVEAPAVPIIPTNTTAIETSSPSTSKQSETVCVTEQDESSDDIDDDDDDDTYQGPPIGGWGHSKFNDFEVPMNDDDNNNVDSNLVDMEVPVKDGFPEDSLRYTFSDKARFVKHGFPEDSLRYTYDEMPKYGCNSEDSETSPPAGEGGSGSSSSDNNIYGYGDGAPDISDRSRYGYEDAVPDTRSSSSQSRRMPRRRRTCGADDEDDDHREEDSSCCSTSNSIGSTQSTMRSSLKKFGSKPRRRASITFGREITVNLPGQNEPVIRRTSITFDESVKVKKVPSVKNLTSSPEKLWFQQKEFKAIRRRSLELVEKFEKGQTQGKRYCIRGLEKLTTNRRRRSMEYKYNAWDSVLDEQDIQRDTGTFDEEYMANIYSYVTSKPKEEAVEQGEKDYADIENYMKSTRKLCRRLSM